MSSDTAPPSSPNANRPRLVHRLVGWIARGVRSTRALQELMGLDLRTINYYLRAAEWMGLLEAGPERLLTPLGLEVALGDQPDQAYVRAVWSQPMIAHLTAGRGEELPDIEEVMLAIARSEPDLSPATVRRRASAVRGLMAPAIGVRRRKSPDHLQLALPLVPRAPGPPPSLSPGRAADADPDVYRFLYSCLLDYGELSLSQLRALLDRAGGGELPIGGYVDLALQRGDATRRGERLAISWAGIERRDLAESTSGVILSHANYRQWLRDLRAAHGGDRQAEIRLAQHAKRNRAWDHRLFGAPAEPDTLDRALSGVVLDRSPESYPIAQDPGPPLEPVQAPFLQVWDQPDLVVSLPPSLETLRGGLPAVNQALLRARQGAQGVGPPDLASRPLLVHGGILHPGEALPRSIPDGISLRLRVLTHVPYASLIAALLLLHREHPDRLSIRRKRGIWSVRRRSKTLGALLDVLDSWFIDRGQLPCRRRGGGLGSSDLLAGLQAVGITMEIGAVVVLDERLFQRLRAEPEQMELHGQLRPLADALEAHLSELIPLLPRSEQ